MSSQASASQDGGQTLYHGRFNPVEVLLSNFREHNQVCGLGFDSTRIDALAGLVPSFGWDDPLTALYIRWTLGGLSGSARAKLEVMRTVFGPDKLVIGGNYRAGTLYLPEGAPEFASDMLEWGVIDLGTDRDKSPIQVDLTRAAGLEVFDASAQHKQHTLSHNGRDVPYLDAPGLRVRVPGESESFVPCVGGYADGDVFVSAIWIGHAGSFTSGPRLVGES